MDRPSPDETLTRQRLFIGKIIAAFTHELRNHLAVIKETAGVHQDLIEMDKAVNDLPALMQALRTVDEEVGFLLRQASFLNRFAHRMDTDSTVFSIEDAVDELISLMKRSADEKLITLDASFSQDVAPVFGDPSCLQMVIFFLLEQLMTSIEQGGSIIILGEDRPEGTLITIVPKGCPEMSAEAVLPCVEEMFSKAACGFDALISSPSSGREISILLRRT